MATVPIKWSSLKPKPSVSAKESQKTIKVTTSASSLMWSAFIIFGVFFLGAIACCIGAHCAMACKRND